MPAQAPIGVIQLPWPGTDAALSDSCAGVAWRDRFLSRLHLVFNKEPQLAVVLSVSSADTFEWRVENEQLTLINVTSGELSVSLADHTLGSLQQWIDALPEYDAVLNDTSVSGLLATVLIPSSGTQQFMPARISRFQSILWAIASALSKTFCQAGASVVQAVMQIYFDSAADDWLDRHGSFYGVTRDPGEDDAVYRARVIETVLTPKANNRVIARAMANLFQLRSSEIAVPDAPIETYSTIPPSGHQQHYGQFDVDLSPPPQIRVSAEVFNRVVETQKAAGTRLRYLSTRLGFARSLATPAAISRPTGVRLTRGGTGDLSYLDERTYQLAAAVSRPTGIVSTRAETNPHILVRRDSSMVPCISRPTGLALITFSGQL